jgi:hypothetical protein
MGAIGQRAYAVLLLQAAENVVNKEICGWHMYRGRETKVELMVGNIEALEKLAKAEARGQ